MDEMNFEGAPMTPGDPQAKKMGFDPRNEHPEYSGMSEAWQTTRDVYRGAEGIVPQIEKYMPQRVMGEGHENYEERKALAHFSGLLGALIDAIVGLWARKAPEEDDWGSLGDPEQEGTPAALLWKDADRDRTGWESHRRKKATWLLVYNKVFSLVDTTRPAGELTKEQSEQAGARSFVKRLSPLDVVDWVEVDGRKVDVLIREHRDDRTSLDDGEAVVGPRFLRLRLNGWTRYKVVKDGEEVRVVEDGSAAYEYKDHDGRPRLPLVETKLPAARYGSYNLARMVLAITNLESYLDALMRAGALGQYLAVQGDEEDVRKSVKIGDKILAYPPNSSPPQFVAYMMDSATPLSERVKALADGFWRAAMYEFSDRPSEKTATEVDQEWAAGIGAFLTTLAGAMQDSENEEKMLIAQAEQVGNMDGGSTKFAREYRVEDVVSEMTRVKELVFGPASELAMPGELAAKFGAWILEQLDRQLGWTAGDDTIDIEAAMEDEAKARELERSRAMGLLEEANGKPGFAEEQDGEEAAA